MATEILQGDFRLQSASRNVDAIYRNLSGLRLQMVDGACRRSLKLVGQGDHVEVASILVQHALTEKITAGEHVPRHSVSKLSERVRYPHRFVNDRHVTALPALLLAKIAGVPFLIRHLFQQ